jgi:hypothetical protein
MHIKDDGMSGACNTHMGDEKCYKISFGKPEGKRPLTRHSCRRQDDIKMGLEEIR